MSSTQQKSTVNIQDLVDCFDDIPDLMKTMHKLTKSCPSSYPGAFVVAINVAIHFVLYRISSYYSIDVHQSASVDSALRGHQPVDISKPGNGHKVDRMAQQALKVLDQLSKIQEVKNATNLLGKSGYDKVETSSGKR